MKNPKKDDTTKRPWPTKDAMEQVYALKLWGDNKSNFYSGIGSHHPEVINPYIVVLNSFLTSFKTPLVVCDLGCGDFNVGKQLVNCAEKYIALDIVTDLIAHNKVQYVEENLEFHCLDITSDQLPSANCAILRQVLQHLSNAEIQRLVAKLPNFKYVVLTEHLPEGDFIPNKDIISGQGTRLKKQSGLDLLAPPFHLKVKDANEVLSITSNNFKGRIVTTIYTMF